MSRTKEFSARGWADSRSKSPDAWGVEGFQAEEYKSGSTYGGDVTVTINDRLIALTPASAKALIAALQNAVSVAELPIQKYDG